MLEENWIKIYVNSMYNINEEFVKEYNIKDKSNIWNVNTEKEYHEENK